MTNNHNISGGGFPPLRLKKDKKKNNNNNILPVNIHEILNTKEKESKDKTDELVTVTDL